MTSIPPDSIPEHVLKGNDWPKPTDPRGSHAVEVTQLCFDLDQVTKPTQVLMSQHQYQALMQQVSPVARLPNYLIFAESAARLLLGCLLR